MIKNNCLIKILYHRIMTNHSENKQDISSLNKISGSSLFSSLKEKRMK